jgi:polyisoprenyl-teichoic acid--peptidoglycan teichoic acid transferase
MRTRPAVLVLAVASLVAACTAAPDPVASSSGSASPSTSATSPSPSATPDVVVRGADARLAALVEKLYAGRTGVKATATTGTWKSEKVAVVTAGKDVTLAVGPDWKVVGGWWPSLGKGPDLGKRPRFVLVVGSDARPDEPLKGSRGDTLQVLGIDGKGGGGVMGIPRDTWVRMPGGGSAKINAAFSTGGGAAQLAAVRRLTGLPVEGYVATGFKGFKAIVNQSGGLQMEIAKKIVFLHKLTIPSGKQSLSGKEALAYARERKSLANGDFGRSAHQGDLLLAAAVAARLSGVGSVPKEMTVVSRNAVSDLSAADALTFVASFYRLSPGKVGHEVAVGSIGTSSDGQSIVKVNSSARAVFARFRDGRL